MTSPSTSCSCATIILISFALVHHIPVGGLAVKENEISDLTNGSVVMMAATEPPKGDIHHGHLHNLIEEQTPPIVTEPKGPHFKVVSSSFEMMQCRAEGHPVPSYEWYRDGQLLKSDNPFVKGYSNGSLILTRFDKADNGYYSCRASNVHGTSMSDMVHIVVLESVSGTSLEEEHTVTEGEPFDLPCDNIHMVPGTVKRWYYNLDHELPLDKRRGIDSHATLHFAYTVKEDSKKYKCGLVHGGDERNTIALYAKGELKVEAQTDPSPGTRPTLRYGPVVVKAVVGDKVTLECFFASKPEATVKWFNASNHRINKDDPRYKVCDHTRKLIIQPVMQQDEGDFTCEGENALGNAVHSIHVNVTSPPMLLPGGALTVQTMPDKRDTTLKCKTKVAIGENLNSPQWFRNGQRLTRANLPDPSRYSFLNDMTELNIRDLDKEADTACFQCNSTNSEGYLFFDAYLRVIKSIEVSKRPADASVVSPGDTVDISVQYSGDVCCVINMHWYHKDIIITPETWPVFQTDLTTGTLLLNTSLVPEKDLPLYTGLYMCRVSNQFQNVDVAFTIELKGEEPEPVLAGELAPWWVWLVCGIALILIVLTIVCILHKRRNPGSTYKLEEQELKHHLNPEEDLKEKDFQAF